MAHLLGLHMNVVNGVMIAHAIMGTTRVGVIVGQRVMDPDSLLLRVEDLLRGCLPRTMRGSIFLHALDDQLMAADIVLITQWPIQLIHILK